MRQSKRKKTLALMHICVSNCHQTFVEIGETAGITDGVNVVETHFVCYYICYM